MKQLCIILIVYLFCGISSAQDTIPQNQAAKDYVKLEGDTYFLSSIPLNEVIVFADMKFQSTQEIYRYLLLKRRAIKVYPYAKLAAEKLTSLQDSISQLSSNRKKKKYTKQMQKYIEGSFSEEFKLQNMVYQGTVLGPSLWNAFFEDARNAINITKFIEIVFADDLNAYRHYGRNAKNCTIRKHMGKCQ